MNQNTQNTPTPKSTQNPQSTQSTPIIQNTPTAYYAIHICASKTPIAANDARLKGQACDTIHASEWIKYYTAADTDRAKVAAKLPDLKTLFPDCWIISFTR